MATLVSKSGGAVIELADWVRTKNDPAITALFAVHEQVFNSGRELQPNENPALDGMYNQFFAETNQELVR